jgi:serine/threonine-protein kinase
MDTDRNLLFGVLALQADLIDKTQFADVCAAWTARKDTPLAILLLERGWISPADKTDVERLLERKLKKHGGDANASLAAVADAEVEAVLAVFKDSDIQRSLAEIARHPAETQPSTVVSPSVNRQRYALLRLHAKGGIGQVWLARDGQLSREVALKELRPERSGDASLRDRFLQEARITGQLEHPGIVPVYELAHNADDDQPFYTMRFVRGRTLTEAIRAHHASEEKTSLGLRNLLNAFVGVCNTVAYAHARGVVHRDLKGANVLLGDFGEVIVFDWGLAKMLGKATENEPAVALPGENGRDETLHGMVLGTPAYMPPEQARGEIARIDQRSDTYSLGAILYEILTNRPPFLAATAQKVVQQVLDQEPERPSRLAAGVPPALEAVCLKALAKDPASRYQDARALGEEVQRWLADEPVRAYPDPLSVRLGRWARRHRTLVAGLAALVSTALLAMIVANVLINQQKERAVKAEGDAVAHARRAEGLALRYHDGMDFFLQDLTQSLTTTADLQAGWVAAFDSASLRGGRSSVPRLSRRKLDPQREEFLRQMLGYLQKVLDDQGADPVVRQVSGQVAARMGDLHRLLGLHARAEEAYRRAEVLFQQLAAEDSVSADILLERARNLDQLGRLLVELGRFSEAAEQQRQAQEVIRAFGGDFGQHPRLRYELANVLVNRGIALHQLRRFEEAGAAFQEGASLAEQLQALAPDAPEFRECLARARSSLGTSLIAAGHQKDGEIALDEAYRLLEELVQQFEGRPEYRLEFLIAATNRGALFDLTKQFAEAEALYQKILPLAEKLAADFPAVSDYQAKLAGIHFNLASARGQQKKWAEAEKSLRRASTLWQELAAREPEVPDHRAMQARALNQLALSLRLRFPPRPAEAEKTWEKARVLFEELVQENPHQPDYQRRLGGILYVLGLSREQSRQLSEAGAAYQESIQHLEKAVTEFTTDPDQSTTRGDLAQCRFELGRSMLNLTVLLSRRWQSAFPFGPVLGTSLAGFRNHWLREERQLLEKGLDQHLNALVFDPQSPEYRQGVQMHFGGLVEKDLMLGDHEATSRLAEKVIQTFPDDAEQRYHAAQYLALAALVAREDVSRNETERTKLVDDYAGRAMHRLREAVGKGLREPMRLRRDPNLAGLRGRDDFRKLLTEIEKAANSIPKK